MYYQTYRSRGLLIGSGPIEAAHRLVLQKRMKLSGQKWTKKGAQAVANLRVVHLNQQWDRVINLINQHPPRPPNNGSDSLRCTQLNTYAN